MNISNENEERGGNFIPKEVYQGKANYRVVAVNPDKAKLKELNQFVPEDEPVYTGEREINGINYKLANITVYLQSPSNFDIVDRVTYTIVDNVQESSSGKLAVINKYGSDTWLEKSHIDAKTMPSNMEWFVNEGIKPMKRGEKDLVNFIRALRNFSKITMKSTQEDKDKYITEFDEADLQKMFKGDFKDIRNIIMSNPDANVGFLLGARNADSGKVYQDMYKEYPLRKYMVGNDSSNEYIVKAVKESQDNGRYANTIFNLDNLSYKKYDVNSSPKPDDTTFNEEDHDDLPF